MQSNELIETSQPVEHTPEQAAERAQQAVREDWDPEPVAGGDEIVAELARLREESPVAWTNRKGGYWTVSRYADITAIARDTRRFSNVPRHPRIGTMYTPPLEADRPVHTSFRRLLNQFFTADYLAAHTQWLPELADAHIEALLRSDGAESAGDTSRGDADWVTGLCTPLPATVLCRLIGMPDEDWAVLREWTEKSFHALRDRGNDPVVFAEMNRLLNDYGARLIERARQDEGRDDIVTTLVKDPIAREQLSAQEVFGLVRLLLQAGHSTTAMGMSNTLTRIASDPELQTFLRANPDRVKHVVMEILRVDTPVLANVRRVVEDTEYGGRQLRKDDHLFLAWGAGNHDAESIEHPEKIDPDRPVTQSLTFGHGIHKCPGMPLALHEIVTVTERLLLASTWFEVASEPVRKRWEANGVASLKLRVTR